MEIRPGDEVFGYKAYSSQSVQTDILPGSASDSSVLILNIKNFKGKGDLIFIKGI